MGFNPSVGRADAEDCDTRSSADSVHAIIGTLARLPFSGLVDQLPPSADSELGEVLDDISGYLDEYLIVARRHFDSYARMADAHNELLDQRNAVRSFFGTMEIAP